MLLIIKPCVLSAVQQLSSHPGLALFNSINIVRLSPPNNYELQIPPPFRAITLITLDCKDAEIEGQAILPLPSSHHHGTGICTFQMHQHIRVTTATIFSNLMVITNSWYILQNVWQLLFCVFVQTYISAHFSTILSRLSPFSTLQQGSSWSMVHVGSCRKEPPPSLYTLSRYSQLLPRLQTCSWHETSIK